VLNILHGLNKNFEHLYAIFTHATPFHRYRRCSMISAWRKSSREFRSYRPLPPPPLPSMLCRSLRHPLPPLMGRNARQDSSSTNNTRNNNSHISPTRRRITTMMAAVAVALPTPLLPRVYGPPTLTPGPELFKCGQVLGGSVSSNPSCVRRLCCSVPFPTVLHCMSGHPSCHHSRLCPFTVVRSRLQCL
jgi:hypothetical protein